MIRNIKVDLILISLIILWFSTYSSFNLFEYEQFGNVFDYLGKSLLKGKADLNYNILNIEAFYIDGKFYTYFGIFLAFIRNILNFIYPELFGKWARLSCFTGCLFCIIAFYKSISFILTINPNLDDKTKIYLIRLSIFSFGLGSPLLFLSSSCFIYHEVLIWALCWSLWCIYVLIKIIYKKDDFYLNLLYLSTFAGFALLTRATFGLTYYILIPIVLINKLLAKEENFSYKLLKKILKSLTPIIICTIIQFWYNYARFKSIFVSLDYSKYYQFLTTNKYLYGLLNETGLFNIQRLLPYFHDYFIFSFNHLDNKAPFFKFLQIPINANYGFREQLIPLSIVSPWILFGSGIGIYLLIKESNSFLTKLLTLGFLPQTISILCFFCITHRYSSEFLPAMVFLYLFFLLKIDRLTFYKKIIQLLTILSLISITATLLSTCDYVANWSWGYQQEFKAKLKNKFLEINQSLNKKL